MATALQCPACGHRHRLDAVGDRSVFPCAKCSRQLKTPGQVRGGTSTRPGAGASGARPSGARPTAAGRASSARRRKASSAGQLRVPIRILAWVMAFLLGAVVVRVLAKWTGFVDTNTFVDLMLDRSFATYSRLLVIIPIWALFATLFATAFIEGPAWWARRTSSTPSAPARPGTKAQAKGPARVPAKVPAKAAAAGAGAAASRRVPQRSASSNPPRAPRTETRPVVPPTRGGGRPAPRPQPGASSGSRDVAAAPTPSPDQRPRRIPRRETGS